MNANPPSEPPLSEAKSRSLWEEFFGQDVREKAVLEALERELSGCQRFVDVGANIGQFSFAANRHLRNGKILCIEANRSLRPMLERTIAAARTDADNGNEFEILHKVVSDSRGTVEFFITADMTMSSIFGGENFAVKGWSSPESKQRVVAESVLLDDFFVPGQRTLVKVDIEGAEYRALSAASRFLASDDTKFLVELHPWGDPGLKKYPLHVAGLFRRNRYRARKVGGRYVFGSHYVFEKAGFFASTGSYLFHFPVNFAKFVLHRYCRRWAPKATAFLLRFKRGAS